MPNELNDSLDDLFGGVGSEYTPRPMAPHTPASYTPPTFTESCRSCGGTGSWRGRGRCYTCNGAGKRTFKSSPEARANNRAKAAERKQRTAEENWTDFKAHQPEVAAWIEASPNFSFAVSMKEAVMKWGDLTPGQLAACQKCVARSAVRDAQRETERAEQAQRVAAAPTVNVSRLEQAFATARANAARPGMMGVMIKPIRLTAGEGETAVTVKVTPGSQGSKWEGMLFIKNEDGKKLGYVQNGKFVRKFDCTAVEGEAVVECLNDPEKAAVAYGKAYSRCGICGRGLLNDVSIARGMGPICAERFGW